MGFGRNSTRIMTSTRHRTVSKPARNQHKHLEQNGPEPGVWSALNQRLYLQTPPPSFFARLHDFMTSGGRLKGEVLHKADRRENCADLVLLPVHTALSNIGAVILMV